MKLRGLGLGDTANLDALLDHLLAQRDGEGMHGSCIVCNCQGLWGSRVATGFACYHSHAAQDKCTFGRAVDGNRRQGHEGKAGRDVEARRSDLHHEVVSETLLKDKADVHGGIGFALDERDGQVAKVHRRFKIDDHFLHVKVVRNFNLQTANYKRTVSF